MKGPADTRSAAALCVVFLVATGLFASLGRWQLERAEQNRAVAAEFRAAGEAAPLTDPERAGAAPAELRYRRLRLEGRYVSAMQLLLDNMTRDGVAGYHVLTPFKPAGSARHVLVNRGWIEADPDRSRVPDLGVDDGARRITGRIDRLPRPAIELEGAAERVRPGLDRVSFPTLAEAETLLDIELLPFQLLLDPDAADGFGRGWAPRTMSADRNTAYAGQWFIMAVAAAGLAAWAALRTYGAIRGNSGDDEAAS